MCVSGPPLKLSFLHLPFYKVLAELISSASAQSLLLCELETVNQIILLVTISFKEEVSLVRLATLAIS